MPWRGEHGDMGLRAGDVLGGELAVEVDRGVDLLHDFGRAGGEPAAPHRVAHEIVAPDGSRMTTTGNKPRRYLLPAALGVLAALAAGAVLYGTRAPAGKVAGACPPASTALAAKLAPLAKGDVAAVSIAADPGKALPLAFERPRWFEGDARRFPRARGAPEPVGDLVRALPRRDAGARSPAGRSGGPGFEVVAVNVDTARLERRAAFLDEIGVKALARYADPSGDAFETLRQGGKALGLPVTMLIDSEGCEIGAAAGAVNGIWPTPPPSSAR